MDEQIPITLVTFEGEPGLTASDRLLAAELDRLGLDVRIACWTDSQIDWSASACTVLRSRWDAAERPSEFMDWLGQVEQQTKVVNAPALVRWNFDKRYVLALEAQGVPIIPTLLGRSG